MRKQKGEANILVVAVLSYGMGLLAGPTFLKEPMVASEHLTEACQAKIVQAEGGNYGYQSVEHCLKK